MQARQRCATQWLCAYRGEYGDKDPSRLAVHGFRRRVPLRQLVCERLRIPLRSLIVGVLPAAGFVLAFFEPKRGT